ncbi:MAG: hypothetical protein HYX22_01075 [Candidatus Yanofskybacteria bacterium]|nr:hypothetical protein [Candidatus Yanofskybacteria bacterium]
MSHRTRGDHLSGPYRDALYTVSLYYRFTNNDPEYLACIGFDIDDDKIIVKQIQGNQGKGELLGLFKWERMLLSILTDWANESGFKQIRVIQAKNQRWCRNGDRMKRMYMHYDVTARRSGFNLDQDSGQYIKYIKVLV